MDIEIEEDNRMSEFDVNTPNESEPNVGTVVTQSVDLELSENPSTFTEEQSRNRVIQRIYHISDSHGLLPDIDSLPVADILIHTGDFCRRGEIEEFIAFDNWLQLVSHLFPYRVVIMGNHDCSKFKQNFDAIAEALPHATHIPKVEVLEICGLRILCYPWMWGLRRSSLNPTSAWLKQRKDNIDIIVSHSPQYGILDLCHSGARGGSYDLSNAVKICRPVLHLCGHVHEASGSHFNSKTSLWSVNSAIVDHPIQGISKLGHLIEIAAYNDANEEQQIFGIRRRKCTVVNVQKITSRAARILA